MESKRAGRTHRMLQHAVELLHAEKMVTIVGATEGHIIGMQYLMRQIEGYRGNGKGGWIQYATYATLRDQIDWRDLTLRGTPIQHALLVDHYVIELHFAGLIKALHQFDA